MNINISCYMIKLDFWPWPPVEKWFPGASKIVGNSSGHQRHLVHGYRNQSGTKVHLNLVKRVDDWYKRKLATFDLSPRSHSTDCWWHLLVTWRGGVVVRTATATVLRHRRREEPEWNCRQQNGSRDEQVAQPPATNPARIGQLQRRTMRCINTVHAHTQRRRNVNKSIKSVIWGALWAHLVHGSGAQRRQELDLMHFKLQNEAACESYSLQLTPQKWCGIIHWKLYYLKKWYEYGRVCWIGFDRRQCMRLLHCCEWFQHRCTEITPPGDNPPAKTWSSVYLEIPPCYLAHFQAPLLHFQCLVCT